jgi:hypothetical protein
MGGRHAVDVGKDTYSVFVASFAPFLIWGTRQGGGRQAGQHGGHKRGGPHTD